MSSNIKEESHHSLMSSFSQQQLRRNSILLKKSSMVNLKTGKSAEALFTPFVSFWKLQIICLDILSILILHWTRARWKVLGLANNWCDTEDKRPYGRDPDRSWCHHHTGVKPFRLQSMDSWTAIKKAYPTMAVTPVPLQVSTLWPLVMSFTSVVG